MPPRPNSRFGGYDVGVFVNCPFDSTYKPLFEAIDFTVIHCGFRARCALEIQDGSQVRIEKIFQIVEECRFGIHDLSRTDPDPANHLPRFNMPLELGMFLGAKRLGNGVQKRKCCLILDIEPYRYQKFISDIAGQDIRAHSSEKAIAIRVTRDWLRAQSKFNLPGGAAILRHFDRFMSKLPQACRRLRLKVDEITFNDFTNIATEYLKANLIPATRS